MAAWFTALKAILPHLGTIISATGPAFTKRQAGATIHDGIMQDQIAELQAAAAQNAAHLSELAAQMQSTVAALEHAANLLERRLHTVKVFSAIAMGLSVLAICVALATIMAR